MYFIHYIQTYASVNRKGSELQEYVLKLKDSLIKNREVPERGTPLPDRGA